jgi:hypothetical protein
MDLVRRIGKTAFLAFAALMAIGGPATHGEPARGPDSINMNSFTSPEGMQSIDLQQPLSQRDIIFRSLLASQGKDLNYPGFPRTWHEESISQFVNSNTNVGVNTGIASGGVSIEYKWVLKTTVVIIAANRPDDTAQTDPNGVTINPVDLMQFQIFRYDPATQRQLPIVRKDYPMVAFCAYEASLNYSNSGKGGLQFFGTGETAEAGTTHTIVHTLFSRLFQVDGSQSPDQMLNELCVEKFTPQVQKYVLNDFGGAVIEMTAHYSYENQCQPDPVKDGPQGDAGCMAWNKQNVAVEVQRITTPRCVINKRGVHRCEVHSKLNGGCSMFWDRSQRKALPINQVTTRNAVFEKATNTPYEFPCDESQGLTCSMIRQPLIFLNVPIWQGAARCVQK